MTPGYLTGLYHFKAVAGLVRLKMKTFQNPDGTLRTESRVSEVLKYYEAGVQFRIPGI